MGHLRPYLVPEELLDSWIEDVKAANLVVRAGDRKDIKGRPFSYVVERRDERVSVMLHVPDRDDEPFGISLIPMPLRSHRWLFGWFCGKMSENLVNDLEKILIAHGAEHFLPDQAQNRLNKTITKDGR